MHVKKLGVCWCLLDESIASAFFCVPGRIAPYHFLGSDYFSIRSMNTKWRGADKTIAYAFAVDRSEFFVFALTHNRQLGARYWIWTIFFSCCSSAAVEQKQTAFSSGFWGFHMTQQAEITLANEQIKYRFFWLNGYEIDETRPATTNREAKKSNHQNIAAAIEWNKPNKQCKFVSDTSSRFFFMCTSTALGDMWKSFSGFIVGGPGKKSLLLCKIWHKSNVGIKKMWHGFYDFGSPNISIRYTIE